jgi:hypothetical protein
MLARSLCTVRVYRQKFTLEDAIGSHACSLEASRRVTNGIPLGCSLFLPVHTVNCVQTLKASGHVKTVEWLLGKDPLLINKVDKAGCTVLHTAAAAGKRAICTLLVNGRADLEAKDGKKDTPLLLVASRDRDTEMLHHLVHLRADPNARARQGYTPLLLAASRRSVKTIRALGALGCDLEAKANTNGWPAMLTAAAKGYADVVECLAELGASVEVTDDLGSPALFLAAQQGHLAAVQMLVLYGANLRASDCGHTLFNYYALQHPAVLAWCTYFAGDGDGGGVFSLMQGARLAFLDRNAVLERTKDALLSHTCSARTQHACNPMACLSGVPSVRRLPSWITAATALKACSRCIALRRPHHELCCHTDDVTQR